jgi:hypothetical protein
VVVDVDVLVVVDVDELVLVVLVLDVLDVLVLEVLVLDVLLVDVVELLVEVVDDVEDEEDEEEEEEVVEVDVVDVDDVDVVVDVVVVVAMQMPRPSQTPAAHGLSIGSGAVHELVVSSHDSAQLASPSGPGHGSPACTLQVPELQVSTPVQKSPSSQADPSGSGAVQLPATSLHDSAQLPSPSGPGHGSPAWTVHVPLLQVSAPSQNTPSLHALPSGSGALQRCVVSLHDSAQLPSPSGPGHGLPVCALHVPPWQKSAPVQKSPSSQVTPSGSGAVQLWAGSLHDSEQLPSPSGPGHGLPEWTQAPL